MKKFRSSNTQNFKHFWGWNANTRIRNTYILCLHSVY